MICPIHQCALHSSEIHRHSFNYRDAGRRTANYSSPMVYFRSHVGEVFTVEVTLAVAADYANITNDGKLNIMGIFQEVNPVSFPTQLQQMFLVISFEAGPAEFEAQKAVHIAFMDEDGNQKVTLDVPVVVPRPVRPGRRAYFSQVIGLGGLPIEGPGDHQFAILVGGDTKGSVSLHVNEPSEEVHDE